tara:strand:+ start:10485 stop:11957 length:1473 start_codon:yes stop_codon:yes gene_type:complete
MPSWLETLLDMTAQFTGGREPAGPHVVWFGIAALCWGTLALVAYHKVTKRSSQREGLLLMAFTLGFARELFMISVKIVQALGWVDPVRLHVIFPPLEHLLHNLAMVVAAAAFMRFVSRTAKKPAGFLRIGTLLNVACYLITFWWWAGFILGNVDAKFGHTWCDVLFHTVMSVLLVWAIVFLWKQSHGWLRNTVCTAFLLMFLFQFLKIPDIFTNEIYGDVLSPLRHGFYLVGILLLGYVYTRELAVELENAVQSERLSALGQAMAGLVHESRNALARSQAGLNLLSVQLSERPDLHRYINETISAQRDLQRLFADVQAYASPPTLSRMWCEIPELVTHAWQNVKKATGIRDCELVQRIESESTSCFVDAFYFEGVFRNLIENSIDACEGPVRLCIEYSDVVMMRNESEVSALQIAYSDNGEGVTSQQLERVFKAFYTTKRRGSGLGMTVAMQTVQLHGGEIDVVANPGAGAKFTITLPRELNSNKPLTLP